MITFDKDSFSGSFECIRIKTQHNDLLNEVNIYLPYYMDYGQPPQCDGMGSSLTYDDFCVFNYPFIKIAYDILH